MKIKRLLCLALASAALMIGAQANVLAENLNGAGTTQTVTYTCDFKQLVKDNAQTNYGTTDNIIKLDAYTTANLTYDGTYVTADGQVCLLSSQYGKYSYTNGSYIEFTAPCDGKLEFKAVNYNYFVGGKYVTYNNKGKEQTITVNLKKGQQLQISPRVENTNRVNSLTFTYDITTAFAEGAADFGKNSDETGTLRFLTNVEYDAGTAESYGFVLVNIGDTDPAAPETLPDNATVGTKLAEVGKDIASGETYYYDIKNIPQKDADGISNTTAGIYAVPYIKYTDNAIAWGKPFSYSGELNWDNIID